MLQVGADIADAMEYLHPAIVHRDLKSQNSACSKHLLVGPSGQCRCFLSRVHLHSNAFAYPICGNAVDWDCPRGLQC